MNEIPKHIGFIMDGNGRWAKERGKPRSYGHQMGSKVIYDIVQTSFDAGVYVVSLYAFSTENWSRPKEEVEKIFSLLAIFIKKYTKTLIKNGARLLVSGDKTQLPKKLQDQIIEVEQKTVNLTKRVLNIAINYGSRTEIVSAINELVKLGKTVTEESFKDYLYTKGLPDVDLIIRTSGESRISNFLLYQSAYAELYFTPVLWPDFNGEELQKAIAWYCDRDRRYGKIK